MIKAYAGLAGVLLLVAAFFYGTHVQAGLDAGAALKAAVAAAARTAKADTATESRTLSAATHVDALHVASHALREEIARTELKPRSIGDAHDPTISVSLCGDPFADARFRLLYDAGSRAAGPPGEAGDLL